MRIGYDIFLFLNVKETDKKDKKTDKRKAYEWFVFPDREKQQKKDEYRCGKYQIIRHGNMITRHDSGHQGDERIE